MKTGEFTQFMAVYRNLMEFEYGWWIKIFQKWILGATSTIRETDSEPNQGTSLSWAWVQYPRVGLFSTQTNGSPFGRLTHTNIIPNEAICILFGISSYPPKQVIGIVFPHPSSNSNATNVNWIPQAQCPSYFSDLATWWDTWECSWGC